jgi:hypothetical protein
MKCQEFESIIISLARGQSVEAAARETALAHLDQCARCASAFEEQQALTAGIRVAAESLANQGASARVEEALRFAFREQVGRFTAKEINPQPTENWRWSRWVIGAAAAAILLVAFLAGADWLKSPPANQKPEAINLPATPSVPAPGQERESQSRDGGRRDQKQKTANNFAGSRRLSWRPVVRQSAESANGVANRFFPLVEEGELPPLESGLIVRGEAPASALITLGLPITAENINRPVQVDLLLGQDGLARAIRFVP